jgi:hypothetical protein
MSIRSLFTGIGFFQDTICNPEKICTNAIFRVRVRVMVMVRVRVRVMVMVRV